MAWNPGQTLQHGKYTIDRILGQGGFGITYLVKTQKGQSWVIKTLNDHLAVMGDFGRYQQDFINEALRLAKFRHPHIVRVEEVIQEGDRWGMVMEYIDGGDLGRLIWKQGAIPETQALHYIRQIGDALSLVHGSGLLHRDIKPLNIMLRNQQQEAVLVDFGIAREFTPNLTQTQTEFLSSGFAPIEQYDWRAKRGAFTDVYALAATLYALVTGEIPIPAPMRAFGMELTAPQSLENRISDRLNQAILQGMALKPEDRPQSVQEWLNLLENVPHQKPLNIWQEKLRQACENHGEASGAWRNRFRQVQQESHHSASQWRDRLRQKQQ